MKFFRIVNGFHKLFCIINAQKRCLFGVKKHLFILSLNILNVFIMFILIFDFWYIKVKLFETYHLCNTVLYIMMIAGVTTANS
jgi:hypothetical protein